MRASRVRPIDDAINQMSRAVGDDLTYCWGWSQFAEWYEALSQVESAEDRT
jgi:hypothetical protein